MKKLLVLIVVFIVLGSNVFAGPKKEYHFMFIHGWVFDLFTHNPITHQWVYFRSYNNNAWPHQDSALTNSSGHYHLDSILYQNHSPLDIEIYTYDCTQNKKSYHFSWYDQPKTFNFTICSNIASQCKSEWEWSVNPLNTLAVQFDDESHGNITNWHWDFGDGDSSILTNPLHTYANAGTYQVILEVRDTNFHPPCINADTQYVTVVTTNYYNLAGQVFAGSFPQSNGIASLYYLEPHGYVFLDSCQLNSNGVYFFYQIPEGYYLVQITGNDTANPGQKYWPTYFGDKITWQNSQILNLQSDYFQGDVHLESLLPPTSGPGSIGGTVYRENMGNQVAVANVEIMLADNDGNYITYTFSGQNGAYSFPQLAYGTYHLHAEIPGLTLSPVTVTIDATQPEIPDLALLANNPAIGISEHQAVISTGPVYPNPTHGDASIDITLLKQQKVKLLITDILGIPLLTIEKDLGNGRNTLEISSENFVGGTYILNLISPGNFIVRKKFEVIR